MRLAEEERKRLEEERIKEEERAKEEARKREEERLAEEERKRLEEEERKRLEEERRKEEERIRKEEERLGHRSNKVLRNAKRKNREENDDDSEEKFYRPEFVSDPNNKEKSEQIWKYMDTYSSKNSYSIEKNIVSHIELTLARNRFDLSKEDIFLGTALSVRDRLLENWNDTQMFIKNENPKRINYISIEFLLGRQLQNALINMKIEDQYRIALSKLGFNIEEIYEMENDSAIGKGSVGNLASFLMDSLTTHNYPAWGYGIRYDFGAFRQYILNNQQQELPEFMLTKENPWEIQRLNTKYVVKYFGNMKYSTVNGKQVYSWENTHNVLAVAYDTIIPGWNTHFVNTLRLWKSFPCDDFDFNQFMNQGNFKDNVFMRNATSHITSVLYPSDDTIKLMQEYFLVSATVQDIIRTFQRNNLPWSEFPNKNAIQLNDTHSTLAIPELLRLLVDDHGLGLSEAMDIVKKTFSFTCHNVLHSTMEHFSVDLVGKILPRHLELIHLLDQSFLEEVWKKHPYNCNRQKVMSCLSEHNPQQIRFTNLAISASHFVNGVSSLHTDMIKGKLEYFDDFFLNKINNVTNGVSTRRWINLVNAPLSKLITDYSKSNEWLDEWRPVEHILENISKDSELEKNIHHDMQTVKLLAKRKLVAWLNHHFNLEVSEEFMFDVQLMNVSENNRQLMSLLYSVNRYLSLKSMSPEDRVHVVKRIKFFGGRAEMLDESGKNIIRLINQIASIVNHDNDTNSLFKIIFIPDFRTSMAEVVIPASDVFESLSCPGTAAGSTSNMMAALNGGLLIASRDGTNIEISEQIKENNIFLFGKTVDQANWIRHKCVKENVCDDLKHVLEYILSENFGNVDYINTLLKTLLTGHDHFLVSHDYHDYSNVQKRVDINYQDKELWSKMVINCICGMGRFSSDRVINEYARKIWKVEPFLIPEPSTDPENKQIITKS